MLRKIKFVAMVDFVLSLKHQLLSPFSATASSVLPTNISLPPPTTSSMYSRISGDRVLMVALELKLDVKMESPQILIPTRANDYIIVDFGNLIVTNKFIVRNLEYNSISLSMNNIRIFFHDAL